MRAFKIFPGKSLQKLFLPRSAAVYLIRKNLFFFQSLASIFTTHMHLTSNTKAFVQYNSLPAKERKVGFPGVMPQRLGRGSSASVLIARCRTVGYGPFIEIQLARCTHHHARPCVVQIWSRPPQISTWWTTKVIHKAMSLEYYSRRALLVTAHSSVKHLINFRRQISGFNHLPS